MFLQELSEATQKSGMETKEICSLIMSGLALLINLAMLWVVFTYTRETKRMQQAVTGQSKELSHQIRLSIMPSLLVEMIKDWTDPSAGLLPDFGDRIRLINEGNGTAVNVEIDDIQIPPQPDFPDCKVAFQRVPFIRSKESPIVKHVSLSGDQPFEPDLLLLLQENHAGDRVFDLLFRFDDIEGTHYLQTGQIGKGGLKLGPVKLA